MSNEQNLSKEQIEKKLNVFRKMWSVYKQLPKRNLISIAIDSNNLDEEKALAMAVWHQKDFTTYVDEYDDLPFYPFLDEEESYNLTSEISSTLDQIFRFLMKASSSEFFDSDANNMADECHLISDIYKTFLEKNKDEDDEWS